MAGVSVTAQILQLQAVSEYTRADKLGLHKNNSLYNAYRIDKFGAKPVLGSPFINLD